ncbi:basic proline-rich protein [Kutzneria sp. 744]|nr:basic proline-rich protein [Kutzneria sp. 744]
MIRPDRRRLLPEGDADLPAVGHEGPPPEARQVDVPDVAGPNIGSQQGIRRGGEHLPPAVGRERKLVAPVGGSNPNVDVGGWGEDRHPVPELRREGLLELARQAVAAPFARGVSDQQGQGIRTIMRDRAAEHLEVLYHVAERRAVHRDLGAGGQGEVHLGRFSVGGDEERVPGPGGKPAIGPCRIAITRPLALRRAFRTDVEGHPDRPATPLQRIRPHLRRPELHPPTRSQIGARHGHTTHSLGATTTKPRPDPTSDRTRHRTNPPPSGDMVARIVGGRRGHVHSGRMFDGRNRLPRGQVRIVPQATEVRDVLGDLVRLRLRRHHRTQRHAVVITAVHRRQRRVHPVRSRIEIPDRPADLRLTGVDERDRLTGRRRDLRRQHHAHRVRRIGRVVTGHETPVVARPHTRVPQRRHRGDVLVRGERHETGVPGVVVRVQPHTQRRNLAAVDPMPGRMPRRDTAMHRQAVPEVLPDLVEHLLTFTLVRVVHGIDTDEHVMTVELVEATLTMRRQHEAIAEIQRLRIGRRLLPGLGRGPGLQGDGRHEVLRQAVARPLARGVADHQRQGIRAVVRDRAAEHLEVPRHVPERRAVHRDLGAGGQGEVHPLRLTLRGDEERAIGHRGIAQPRPLTPRRAFRANLEGHPDRPATPLQRIRPHLRRPELHPPPRSQIRTRHGHTTHSLGTTTTKPRPDPTSHHTRQRANPQSGDEPTTRGVGLHGRVHSGPVLDSHNR